MRPIASYCGVGKSSRDRCSARPKCMATRRGRFSQNANIDAHCLLLLYDSYRCGTLDDSICLHGCLHGRFCSVGAPFPCALIVVFDVDDHADPLAKSCVRPGISVIGTQRCLYFDIWTLCLLCSAFAEASLVYGRRHGYYVNSTDCDGSLDECNIWTGISCGAGSKYSGNAAHFRTFDLRCGRASFLLDSRSCRNRDGVTLCLFAGNSLFGEHVCRYPFCELERFSCALYLAPVPYLRGFALSFMASPEQAYGVGRVFVYCCSCEYRPCLLGMVCSRANYRSGCWPG